MEPLLWQLPPCKVSFVKCSATVLARSLIRYQVLQETKSLNACIMFASLLNVILLFITVVVVCPFSLPTYPNPNLGETSLLCSSPGWTTRTKSRLEWNRGTQPRKETSDAYLGKRLSCYHFDWIFKFAVKWPSMCEKMVFLPKVRSVWSWMPLNELSCFSSIPRHGYPKCGPIIKTVIINQGTNNQRSMWD